MARRLKLSQLKLPLPLIVFLLLVWGVFYLVTERGKRTSTRTAAAGPGEYLFCFWNVENLFDDTTDENRSSDDKVYDVFFSKNPQVLQQKLDHLSKTLLQLNDGKGPDILAVAEVEGQRAADLLAEALNDRLAQSSLHYTNVLTRDLFAGRHITTAILTRLPVGDGKVRLLGSRQRIVEGQVVAGGATLQLIVSHWTSRLTDKTGESRAKYAKTIYDDYRAQFQKNPAIDMLICGDLNDNPEDPSVLKGLHSTDDVNMARARMAEPLLFNPFLHKDPKQYGTHNYSGHWQVFDQILVSPGMLDNQGWVCEIDTVRTVNDLTADRRGRPQKFGDERYQGVRGFSDHFPVIVKLRVGEK